MATYSNNTTIKINAAVSNSLSTASGTLYTAPSNGYAIIELNWGNGPPVIKIGVLTVDTTTGRIPHYVGPGQSVTFTGQTSGTTHIVGVEFLNTP